MEKFDINNLSYKKKEIGKSKLSSKILHTWKFSIDKNEHKIELINNKFNERKKIIVDDNLPVIKQEQLLSYKFSLNIYKCELYSIDEDKFDVKINGKSFQKLMEKENKGVDNIDGIIEVDYVNEIIKNIQNIMKKRGKSSKNYKKTNIINQNIIKFGEQSNKINNNENNKLFYESEINELKIKLKEEINKNQILINENAKLTSIVKELNPQIDNIQKYKSTIKKLENELKQKNLEIEYYKSNFNKSNNQLNNCITSIKSGEKIFAINFVSLGIQDIGRYCLPCRIQIYL